MYVGALTLDVLLGDVHSLKEKRAVVRPVVAELRRRYAVAAAEVGDAGTAGQVTDVLDACERLLAGRPEVQLLSVRRQLVRETDD